MPAPGLTLADPTPPHSWRKGSPSGYANIGSVEVEDARIANAERVVAGMKAGFRACYNRGLDSTPDAHGKARIVARVNGDGEVISATVEPTGILNEEINACLTRRVQSAKFDAPEPSGSQATLSFTVIMTVDDTSTDYR
jgi:hypothetical protein